MDKRYANRGVERNKKPLKNLEYKVEIKQLKSGTDAKEYEPYKYGDGYLIIYWKYQDCTVWSFHGFVTEQWLKDVLGQEQWRKFTQGKREFIEQRRIDNHNISKPK